MTSAVVPDRPRERSRTRALGRLALTLVAAFALLVSGTVLVPAAQAAGTGTVSGTVTGLGGAPLAGAYVDLVDCNFGGCDPFILMPGTTTGTDGSYSLSDVPAGSYTLSFQGPDGSGYPLVYLGGGGLPSAQTFVVVADQPTVRNFQLQHVDGASVTGTLYIGGAPAVGTEVTLLSNSDALTSYAAVDGTFGFSNLVAGEYWLRFGPADDPVYLGTGGAIVTDEDAARVFVLGAGQVGAAGYIDLAPVEPEQASISGTTVEDGSPAVGVTVDLVVVAVGTSQDETTGAAGDFVFSDLLAGEYLLRFPDLAGGPWYLGAGDTDLVHSVAEARVLELADGEQLDLGEVELTDTAAAPDSASVSGTLVGLGGGAEADEAVDLVPIGSGVVRSTTSDELGAFSFTGVAAGDYLIRFPNYGSAVQYLGTDGLVDTAAAARVLTVVAGEALYLGVIDLTRGQSAPETAVLRGTLLDDGTAAPDVAVELVRSDGTGTVASATSDVDGEFELTGVAAGEYRLRLPDLDGAVRYLGPDGLVEAESAARLLTLTEGQTLDLGDIGIESKGEPTPTPTTPTPTTPTTKPVPKDTRKPVVKIKKLKAKAKRNKSVRGTIKDDVSPRSVTIRVIEKRGKKWYAFTGKKWKKVKTRKAAWKKAKALHDRKFSKKGAWKIKLRKVKKGRIQVRYFGTDTSGNKSKTKTYKRKLR